MLARYGLPYFHMSECNANEGIFEHLTEKECDACAREAIRIARNYPTHGHAMIVDQSAYRMILEEEGFDCDPYSFLAWGQFIHVNRWVHQNRPDEKITLSFESGYSTQKRAGELLQAALGDYWGGKNHVLHCDFIKKEDSEPAQAGDLLAWHVRKGFENERKGKPIRRDTLALIEDRRALTIDFTSDRLRKIREDFVRATGSLREASRQLFLRPLVPE